jgi:small subunit ribosomal protein S17
MAESSSPSSAVANPRVKIRLGTVVSDKMQKTVVVAVERTKRHRLYNKTLKRTTRYKVHDERNECRLGDRVRIIETRPLSKEKRWRVLEILRRGNVAEIQPQEIDANLAETLAEEGAEAGPEGSEA